VCYLDRGNGSCSSDEEEQALRKEKEDAKRKETMVRRGVDRRVAEQENGCRREGEVLSWLVCAPRKLLSDGHRPPETDPGCLYLQALLEAFDKTRESSDRAESGYGAIDSTDAAARFKSEQSQRGGKWARAGRVGATQDADSGIESDIGSSMKLPMLLGCLMIIVLLCALVGVRMEQTSAAASGASDLHAWSGGGNVTSITGPTSP
jgi:hypothetical protein